MNTLGFLNLTGYQVLHLHLKHHHDYIIIIVTEVCRWATRPGLTPGFSVQPKQTPLQLAQNCYWYLALGQIMSIAPHL